MHAQITQEKVNYSDSDAVVLRIYYSMQDERCLQIVIIPYRSEEEKQVAYSTANLIKSQL